MEERYYYVYMNTNRWNLVLHTGVTNNILDNCHSWLDQESREQRANRETPHQVRGDRIIKEFNPKWRDLSEDLSS